MGYPKIEFFQDGNDTPLETVDFSAPSWSGKLQRISERTQGADVIVSLPESEIWCGTAPNENLTDSAFQNMATSMAANALSRAPRELTVVTTSSTDDYIQIAAVETRSLEETRDFLATSGFDRFHLSGGEGFPPFLTVEPDLANEPKILTPAPSRNRKLALATFASAAAAVAMVVTALGLSERPRISQYERPGETSEAVSVLQTEIRIEPAVAAIAPTVFTSISKPGAVRALPAGTGIQMSGPRQGNAGFFLAAHPSELHLISVSTRNAPQIPLDTARPLPDALEVADPVRVAELLTTARSPKHRPADMAAAPGTSPESDVTDETVELSDESPAASGTDVKAVYATGPPARPDNLPAFTNIAEVISDAVEVAQIESVTSQMVQSAAATSLGAVDIGRPVPRHLVVMAAKQPTKATVFKAQPAAITRSVAPPVKVATAAPKAAPRVTTSSSRSPTERVGLESRKLSLVGLFGSSKHRRAIVRLPNGRMAKVSTGDRLEGQQVAAIGDDSLRLSGGSRDLVLKMPN